MRRMVIVMMAMSLAGAAAIGQPTGSGAASTHGSTNSEPQIAKEQPQGAATNTPAAADLPRPTNAALLFWRAWNAEPPTLAGTVDAEFNGRDLAWTPSADVATALAEAQGFILAFVHATELPTCDFGIEYSLGREMDISHLDKLRQSARILVSDARRLQAQGQIDGAVQRVVALYSMAQLVRHDHLSQSSSSSLGFARMASDEVRRLCMANVLTAEQRGRLTAASDALSGKDPFRFADAMRREGAITEHYLSTRFPGDTAGASLLRVMAQGGEPEPVVAAITAMNQATLIVEAGKARDYYNQVADAWEKDDAIDRLHALQDKVLNLGFGPVAFMVCPGLSPAYDNCSKQIETIREARAMLDSATPPPTPVHGPLPPK